MDLLIHVSITVFQSTARERGKHSGDYFTLLRHLLNYAFNNNINVPNAEVLLNNEIDWLKRIRVSCSVYGCCLIAKLCPTLGTPWTVQPSRLFCPWDFSPRILEWVAVSSSRGSSQPRHFSHGSCIAGGFYTTEPPGKPVQFITSLLNLFSF